MCCCASTTCDVCTCTVRTLTPVGRMVRVGGAPRDLYYTGAFFLAHCTQHPHPMTPEAEMCMGALQGMQRRVCDGRASGSPL